MEEKKTSKEKPAQETELTADATIPNTPEDEKDTPAEHLKGKQDTRKSREGHHKEPKDKSTERIAELEDKIASISDRHLRLQAEFDNFRKRTLKEKAELIRWGGESVLSRILPVIDDFDRAIATMKDLPGDDPAKTGFTLIYNKFQDFLNSHNVKEIEAVGKAFDVDLHAAVSKIPAPAEELKGKIVEVVEKGYLLNDKVIRFAKVIIGE